MTKHCSPTAVGLSSIISILSSPYLRLSNCLSVLERECIISIRLASEFLGAADIAHSGLGIGMPQELLDEEERGFVYGHVGTNGMADRVWGDGFGYAGSVGVLFDKVAHRSGGQGLLTSPFAGGEERFAGVGVGGKAALAEEDVALYQLPELW